MALNSNLLFPSKMQVKLWKILNEVYYANFSEFAVGLENEQWQEYLYGFGIDCKLNISSDNDVVVPNPSGQGVLKIPNEIAEKILVLFPNNEKKE